ncbi:hypothetical protein AB1283_00565 [Bacillus sp. S13(2024)]|uniref:hypothetical protein n=1 Tax=Bacillus sp. S13(2024) TaxID=3162885 RepID=UPI003D2251E1
MKDNYIKTYLNANHPIIFKGLGKYQSLTYREILDVGIEEYNVLLNCLLIDKTAFEETNNFSNLQSTVIMCAIEYDIKLKVFEAIGLFFKEKPKLYCSGDDINSLTIYFGEYDEKRHFTDSHWDMFVKIIRLEHNIKEEKTIKFANERARQFYMRFEKLKKENPEKEKVSMDSIIEGISVKSRNLNILQIWDLTTYQIMRQFARLINVEDYENILLGIYTGNVDGTKIKLQDIHWANIFEEQKENKKTMKEGMI